MIFEKFACASTYQHTLCLSLNKPVIISRDVGIAEWCIGYYYCSIWHMNFDSMSAVAIAAAILKEYYYSIAMAAIDSKKSTAQRQCTYCSFAPGDVAYIITIQGIKHGFNYFKQQ